MTVALRDVFYSLILDFGTTFLHSIAFLIRVMTGANLTIFQESILFRNRKYLRWPIVSIENSYLQHSPAFRKKVACQTPQVSLIDSIFVIFRRKKRKAHFLRVKELMCRSSQNTWGNTNETWRIWFPNLRASLLCSKDIIFWLSSNFSAELCNTLQWSMVVSEKGAREWLDLIMRTDKSISSFQSSFDAMSMDIFNMQGYRFF